MGVPSKVGGKPGVIQVVWAVEPLVREPGLGKGGPVSLDPLVVSDAWSQVVHYIQELELGSVNEHDATVLLRTVDAFVLCHDQDKVLADKLEIVVARVKADHRHLVDPVHDEVALGGGDSLWVWREVTLGDISYDCCMAPLKRLVEKMDQLVGILGGDVSGSGLSVSAMDTEMGKCSLSYERSRVGQAALDLSWYDSKS